MAKKQAGTKKAGKSTAVAKAVTAVLGEDIEAKRQTALELDKRIDGAIERMGREVAKAYIAIGKDLKQMKDTGGWQLLGASSWVEYLKSKDSRLKKTYCYYAIKLAKAEGIDNYFDVLTGAQFIEYSKLVTGDKIPLLMADTAQKVKGLSARDTADELAKHIKEHPGKYKRTIEGRKISAARAPDPWAKKFKKQHEAAKDKDAFIKGMEEYLNSLKATKK